MTKPEHCPPGCEFQGETDNPGLLKTCFDCFVTEIEEVTPRLIELGGKLINIVGKDKDKFYLEDKTSIFKSNPRIK